MSHQLITILGSTGSIGCNTLDVLRRHRQNWSVFALCAGHQVQKLAAQCVEFAPQHAVLATAEGAQELQGLLKQAGHTTTQVHYGAAALEQMASHPSVDAVMASMVGAAGLAPCMAAARSGKRLLLANKEAIVLGGAVFMQAVRDGKAVLLPIDSEHSAIFQCMPESSLERARRVRKIILTASGGPFRDRDPKTLDKVTPEEAVAHPNWSMGQKISVDSATMMNKALEVIEAKWLFDLSPQQIEVVIHPQSVIHSLVEFHDTSILAQLGTPDMRVPIAYGLSWPERIESGANALNMYQLSELTFREPCTKRYPCLSLAWQTLQAQEGATAVLNAANEVAVQSFLDKRIRFDHIYAVNHRVLELEQPIQPTDLDSLLALDSWARARAQELLISLEP